jgi:hypothetical protein
MRPSAVRRIALLLPHTVERETWGERTFRTKNKIFVILGSNGKLATVKARKEHQHSIIASDRKTFSVAPYVGRFGWITVRLATVDTQAMGVLIIDAWRRTAPKRIVAAYDAKEQRGPRPARAKPPRRARR